MGIWIIVPDKLIELIRNNAARNLDYPPTAELIKGLIEDFIDDELNDLDESLYSKYSNTFKSISLTTFKRALNERDSESLDDSNDGNGVFQKSEKEVPPLLELLCYYACKKSWVETITYLNIEKSKIRRRYTGKDKSSIERIENINAGPSPTNQIQPVVNNIHISGFSKSHIQVVDNNFWEVYLLPKDKKAILSRYYTHADSSLVKEIIANDEAIPPNDFVLVADPDGNIEQRTITETIKSSARQGVFLIKVILDGGVGKTTFLYWVARHFQDSYNFISIAYLGSLDIRKVIQLAKSLKKQNRLPVAFLIDNVSNTSISTQFERLIYEVKSEPILFDCLFIIAERESRYQYEFNDSNIETLFGGNILSINNVDVDRELIFEKLYTHLLRDNQNLRDEVIKQQTKEQFLNKGIPSISESIFFLIKYLKLSNVINYTFDWEDWGINTFEKQELKYLYAIVSCFYQFGIEVPTTISTKILGYAADIDIIDAINRFGGNKCPIQLSEDVRFLSLRHEHLANWFLDDPKNKNIVLTFFRTFLTEIDNETNAKLLRKIRKVSKTEEFKNSILANEFSLPIYIKIIKDYIELPTTKSFEKAKMLMEQGIAYTLLGNDKEATTSFEAVLKIDEENNHAKDQLARIYLKSPSTYSLAFTKYYEIYKNDGLYALKHMYFIIRKSNEEGVALNLWEGFTFSSSEILEIVKLYIEGRYLEDAIQLINSLPENENSYEIAKLHNLIAHYLPFSYETIDKKRSFFIRAIKLKKELQGYKNDFQFEVDYAVFLYRIREFSASTEYLKFLSSNSADDKSKLINELFINKVRTITKLYFVDIPSWEEPLIFERYLYKQCKDAAAIINRQQKNVENIIKGILILHTVRYHSRTRLPNVFKDATLQLGYAYTYHAEKQINNLLPNDIRNIAENYYEMALNIGAEFAIGDCLDMIRNLQNFKTAEKAKKSIALINTFLSNPINRKCPGFYRMRGNANVVLENYDKAILNYTKAEELIPGFRYTQKKHFINDQAFLYNNIAAMICDMHEKGITIKGYNLNKANTYSQKALQLNPNFEFGLITQERIRSLLN